MNKSEVSSMNCEITGHDQMAAEVARGVGLDGYPVKPSVRRVTGPVSVACVLIDPFLGDKRADVRIEILNESSSQYQVTVACDLFSGSERLTTNSQTIILKCNGTTDVKLSLSFESVRPWSPEDPFLYILHVNVLSENGDCLDHDDKTFGMRNIEVGKDKRIYLNGRPIYLRGNTWVPGYFFNYVTIPFEPSFCEKMLSEQKRQGFNYIRHHTTMPPDHWYFDIADRLGIMMSVEAHFDLDKVIPLIKRYYNHPSVIFWGGCNELHSTCNRPEIMAWYSAVKALDPFRLVYDCSGWGEYDRDTTDVLPQHVGYEFPYLQFEDMYESFRYYIYDCSAKGIPREEVIEAIRSGTLVVDKPQIIHELQGNAHIYSDKTLILDGRMRRIWEEHAFDYVNWPSYVEVNQKFVAACYKVNFEAARRADNQAGFELLVVADSLPEVVRETNRGPAFGDLEVTGTCDALGDSKPILAKDLPIWNGAHIVLLDTHSKPRTLWNDECLEATILASCFDYAPPEEVDLDWRISSGNEIVDCGSLKSLRLKFPGVGKIGELSVPLSKVSSPSCVKLEIDMVAPDYKVSNSWNFWVFPKADALTEAVGRRVYSTIGWVDNLGSTMDCLHDQIPPVDADLFITDKLGARELEYLENGGRMLLLQDHTKEGFSCTSTGYRHRMYHSWVGGHSMGVVVHDHPAMDSFPHEGFNDLQFYRLLQGSNRFMLDDLPVRVTPILEAVPSLENLQSKNSGYLFEISVGKGKLLASGLKLDLAAEDECSAVWLLRSLVDYTTSDKFNPVDQCSKVEMEKAFIKSRDRVWITSPPFHVYGLTDNVYERDEDTLNVVPNILPAGGAVKEWIDPEPGMWGNEADIWGSDEWGCHNCRKAIDGYRSNYWEPNVMPADIGVEWTQQVIVSSVIVEFLDDLSLPSDDGWELQAFEDGKWRKLDMECEKLNFTLWKLHIKEVSLRAFRLYFAKMNAANVDAVANGALAGGVRSGYPFPVTWLKEKSVPRLRELRVELSN